MQEPAWNEEQLETLKREWPRCSAKEIGKMVHKTRNSVIGKARRLKLAPKARPVVRGLMRAAALRSRPLRRPAAIRVLVEEVVPLPTPVPGGVHIVDLQEHHCRAIVGYGEDGSARYCGAHKARRVKTFRGEPIYGADNQPQYVLRPYCHPHAKHYYQW